MILILGAMNDEIEAYEETALTLKRQTWKDFKYTVGTLNSKEVIIAKTGVGKTLSAMFTQHLIESYAVKSIIFSGIAGALDPGLNIGDIVIATDCVQHDIDATALGFAQGEVPYTPYRVIPADDTLRKLALRFKPKSGKIIAGRILTGDQFITSRMREEKKRIFTELAGIAVEMEGASVGLVAQVNEIPFLLIRIISDKTDGASPSNFRDFLRKSSRLTLDLVLHVVNEY